MPTNTCSLHSWATNAKKSKKDFWTLDKMSDSECIAMASECIAMAAALGISSGWMSYSSILANLNIDGDDSLSGDYELFFPTVAREACEEAEDTP